ncbi:MAG: sugar phosphate nucleotidyltransferase [Chloroflexota bacterium]
MKVIIPLAGFGTRMRPHTWSRPKPLLHVAGHTVIGHLLDRLAPITTEEVVFVVGYKGAEIEAWIRHHYSHLDSHFVIQEEALGQAHALWLCRDFLDDGEALVAFGDGIVDADYAAISDTTADGVCLVQEMEDPRKFGVVVTDETNRITDFIEKPKTAEHKQVIAGIYWFRNGRILRHALDTVIREERMTKGEYYLADAYQVLLQQGTPLVAKPCYYWLDAGNPENILNTNARLLSMGFHSDDLVERSYVEDFTAMPPASLHESAQVDAAVIGPYASIGANVTIKNAIVRNSIIDEGAIIENCILDGALIGRRAQVQGQGLSLFVGDDSIVGRKT